MVRKTSHATIRYFGYATSPKRTIECLYVENEVFILKCYEILIVIKIIFPKMTYLRTVVAPDIIEGGTDEGPIDIAPHIGPPPMPYNAARGIGCAAW